MAVYGWTYANAKLKGHRLDYQSRGGCRELWEVVKNADAILPKIAVCLISEDQRNLYPEQDPSWFAGYLDGVKKEKYVIAVGGTQDQLLGKKISGDGYRTQFCVFACVFTGEDIRLYGRKEAMFASLKEKLWEIQRTGIEEENNKETSSLMNIDFSSSAFTGLLDTDMIINANFQMDHSPENQKKTEKANILVSNEENDNQVWAKSLERPVIIRAATEESAKKFLRLFPNGLCTVTGGHQTYYAPIEKLERVEHSERVSQNDTTNQVVSRTIPSSDNPSDNLARIKREMEESDRRTKRIWIGIASAIAASGGALFFIIQQFFGA